MIFESKHSVIESEFVHFRNDSGSFPLHLHRSFEYFAQISGVTRVTVDGTDYILKAGEAVLIFPYQRHSYESLSPGPQQYCIFAPDLVSDYVQSLQQRLPVSSAMPALSVEFDAISGPFLQRAVAYTICGHFDAERQYEDQRAFSDSPILTNLLLFAETNYASSCSLRQASAQLGYDYAYLSRLFKRRTGVSFNHYINLLRIRRAQQLLLSTSYSITTIAELCGYGCVRSFARQFRSISDASPRQYRTWMKEEENEDFL